MVGWIISKVDVFWLLPISAEKLFCDQSHVNFFLENLKNLIKENQLVKNRYNKIGLEKIES